MGSMTGLEHTDLYAIARRGLPSDPMEAMAELQQLTRAWFESGEFMAKSHLRIAEEKVERLSREVSALRAEVRRLKNA